VVYRTYYKDTMQDLRLLAKFPTQILLNIIVEI